MTTSARHDSTWNVREHGAMGDGLVLDSPAIQSVIDQCAEHGGGTVYLPTGQYLTGSLFLRDNISLHLDSGALILGSEDQKTIPLFTAAGKANIRIPTRR